MKAKELRDVKWLTPIPYEGSWPGHSPQISVLAQSLPCRDCAGARVEDENHTTRQESPLQTRLNWWQQSLLRDFTNVESGVSHASHAGNGRWEPRHLILNKLCKWFSFTWLRDHTVRNTLQPPHSKISDSGSQESADICSTLTFSPQYRAGTVVGIREPTVSRFPPCWAHQWPAWGRPS